MALRMHTANSGKLNTSVLAGGERCWDIKRAIKKLRKIHMALSEFFLVDSSLPSKVEAYIHT
jgi:hypothetical protein